MISDSFTVTFYKDGQPYSIAEGRKGEDELRVGVRVFDSQREFIEHCIGRDLYRNMRELEVVKPASYTPAFSESEAFKADLSAPGRRSRSYSFWEPGQGRGDQDAAAGKSDDAFKGFTPFSREGCPSGGSSSEPKEPVRHSPYSGDVAPADVLAAALLRNISSATSLDSHYDLLRCDEEV